MTLECSHLQSLHKTRTRLFLMRHFHIIASHTPHFHIIGPCLGPCQDDMRVVRWRKRWSG